MRKNVWFSLLALILCGFGCTDSFQDFTAIFGDFEVNIERTEANFNGEINDSSLIDLEELIRNYPSVHTIQLESANGSMEMPSAIAMGILLRENNIQTVIPDSGNITENGLYFFLGGNPRQIDQGAKIGVSSWKNSDGQEASSLSIDDPAHLPIIDYFVEMGLNQEKAEEFYFFMINSADSNNVYYLSDSEIGQFGLTN